MICEKKKQRSKDWYDDNCREDWYDDSCKETIKKKNLARQTMIAIILQEQINKGMKKKDKHIEHVEREKQK
jgi:hypothetical protein